MHQKIKFAFIFLLTFSLLLASACGFRLRGVIQLPAQYQPLYITNQDEQSAALTHRLNRQMQQLGIELTQQHNDSKLRLEIFNLASNQRQLAYGATEEYELSLKVKASAYTQQGEPLFIGQEFISSRFYSYNKNSDSLLARDTLKQELLESMETDLLNQLSLRLQALSDETLP